MSGTTTADRPCWEAPVPWERAEPVTARRRVGGMVFGTVILLACGVLGNWPYLITEHVRLDPLHRYLIWAADGMAVIWMLWFGLWHGVAGRPVATGRTDRTFRWVLVAPLSGLAVDVAGTAALAYQEVVGNERGIPARQAHLTGGRTSLNGELGYVSCRFQDQTGAWHESRLCLDLNRHPPGLVAAIRDEQFPAPIDIKYDPDWPPRCWVAPVNLSKHEPMWIMMVCVLLFQGMLIASAVASQWYGQSTPNWAPFWRIVPVWGVALPLGCGAFGKLLTGEF